MTREDDAHQSIIQCVAVDRTRGSCCTIVQAEPDIHDILITGLLNFCSLLPKNGDIANNIDIAVLVADYYTCREKQSVTCCSCSSGSNQGSIVREHLLERSIDDITALHCQCSIAHVDMLTC